LAWQSFNVIIGGLLFFWGIHLAWSASKATTNEKEAPARTLKQKLFAVLLISLAVVYFSLTSSQTDEYYVAREDAPMSTYTGSVFNTPTTPDGSARSAVANLVAFFTSCIFIAAIWAQLKSDQISGIAALSFTWGVTLLGWVSAFTNDYLSTVPVWDQTGDKVDHDADLKSWEGVGLVVAIFALWAGWKGLKMNKQAPAPVAPATVAPTKGDEVVWHAASKTGDNTV
jgi:hypothetical protein